MSACPTCRAELPEGARFCPACGTRVEDERAEATERKVVTTLFADLVGFTALGERHDPEDIDAALRGFYALARTIVERFGGVVEKFIGDAVVGLFGVPAAHEDDAERAIRAGLELVAHMHELPLVGGERLRVRAAVNTGPALVRLYARPEAGEGVLVGDAVNTAARLLSDAPAMGVVAGEMTERLSSRAIAYEGLPAIAAKGKERPVARWLARGPVARRRPNEDDRAGQFVGREIEIAVLAGTFDRAIATRQAQASLIVAEAGLGKTRLVQEFFRLLDERPGFFCTWRQGHCPPYGSDLAFWPLREIVSAHAGIQTSDEEPEIEAKLADCLDESDDAAWLLDRLRPLVGLPGRQAEHGDNFVAWHLFFERMARRLPTVLVIEDVHWASSSTLDFLESLFRHIGDAPLLLVMTARPEFLQQAGGLADLASVIALKGLSQEECARLIKDLPYAPEDEVATRAVSEVCGGNPLFAQELARYVSEQPPDHASDETRTGQPVLTAPDTLTALLGARLDALPEAERQMLGDAAVVGQSFWPDAIEAAGSPPEAIDLTIARLTEHDFFVPQVSLLDGVPQYGFRHALVRQVAYDRMTRLRRARKHAGVARWMESPSGPEFAADVLAYHYETAFDLAVEMGDDKFASELREPTGEALEAAGDLTLPLDVATAERCFRKAVDILRDGSKAPRVLGKWAKSLVESGRPEDGMVAQDELISALDATGQERRAAVARTQKAIWSWHVDSTEWPKLPPVAVDLLRTGRDSEDLVALLEFWAIICFYHDEQREGMQAVNRAIQISERLGLPLPVVGYSVRGIGRCEQGDPGGLEDLRISLAQAKQRGLELSAANAAQNLADQLCATEGPLAAVGLFRETTERARRRRDELTAAFASASLALCLWWSGRWSDAEAIADGLVPDLERRGSELLTEVHSLTAMSSLLRGQHEDAGRLADVIEQASHSVKRFETRSKSLLVLAVIRHSQGDAASALAHAQACLELEGGGRLLPEYLLLLPSVCRACIGAGDAGLAQRFTEHLGSRALDASVRTTLMAMLAGRRGQSAAALHKDAGRRWRSLGVPYEEASSYLALARCEAASGRPSEARATAQRAKGIFLALGAMDSAATADELLSREETL